MSWGGFNLFGKAAAPVPPPQPVINNELVNKARQDAAQHQLNLQKQIAHTDKMIQQCVQLAIERKNKGDKHGALSHLKKKQILEKRRVTLQKFLDNSEVVNMAMDDMQLYAQQAKANEAAVQAMNHVKNSVNPDKVEEAMDELEDGLQTISEVQDVMTRELIAPGVDMSEVDAEFDALGSLEDTGPVSAGAGAAAVAAGAGASAAAAAPAAAQPQPHIPAMPQVPSHVPAQQQAAAAASMDDELAELAGL